MTLIDYAAPMMRIEKIFKDMHNDLLERDYEKAHAQAFELIVESRILHNTISIMKEQLDALRQQTPSVQEGIPATNQTRRNTRQTGTSAGAARDRQARH